MDFVFLGEWRSECCVRRAPRWPCCVHGEARIKWGHWQAYRWPCPIPLSAWLPTLTVLLLDSQRFHASDCVLYLGGHVDSYEEKSVEKRADFFPLAWWGQVSRLTTAIRMPSFLSQRPVMASSMSITSLSAYLLLCDRLMSTTMLFWHDLLLFCLRGIRVELKSCCIGCLS